MHLFILTNINIYYAKLLYKAWGDRWVEKEQVHRDEPNMFSLVTSSENIYWRNEDSLAGAAQ